MKTFENIEQLHEEWQENGACLDGVEFNKSCKTLEEVFEKCPLNFRIWRIKKGYLQFVENLDCKKLDSSDVRYLLRYQPQLADKFKNII